MATVSSMCVQVSCRPGVLMPLVMMVVVFLLYLCGHAAAQAQDPSASGYRLDVPSNYTVFDGEITVDYRIPSNVTLNQGVIEAVDVATGAAVHTATVLAGYHHGQAIIVCGVLDRAGVYEFHIRDGEGPRLYTSARMYASWPQFFISLPTSHVALTTPVILQFSFAGNLCNSLDPSTTLGLRVLYTSVYVTNNMTDTEVRHSEAISDLRAMQNVPRTFGCDLFDMEGTYTVVLYISTTGKPDVVISRSNDMQVQWSRDYELTMNANSIFPCRTGVQLQFTNPECASSEDKVRLYRRAQLTQSSAASPTSLQYIAEQRVPRAGSRMRFDCSLFHESVPAYCFKYVSFSRNKAVTEQVTHCLPSIAGNEAVLDGSWSSWSSWSSCSVSCGSGQRSRHRTCDNPPPSPGARYCTGENIQWRDCTLSCSVARITTPSLPITADPSCECGCTKRGIIDGQIYGYPKCSGSIIWVIETEYNRVITMEFLSYNLNVQDTRTWLKVRDGSSQRANLLLHDYGGAAPHPVQSTRSTLMIELMVPEGVPYVGGFAARYTTKLVDDTALLPDSDSSEGTVWKSIVGVLCVVIVGIIVCVVMILVCQRRNRKKDIYKSLRGNQSSLLASGEMPKSPSNSGQSNRGSANLSLKDGASSSSSPARRDYILAPSTSTHPHSASESSLASPHRFQARSPPGGRHVHHGTRPSSTHVAGVPGSPGGYGGSPVHSPHRPYPIDSKQNPALFNTSPLSSRRSSATSPTHYAKGGAANRRKAPYNQQSSPHKFSQHQDGSSSATYVEPSPRPYNPNHAPLAGEEDLSPTSPVRDYTHRQLPNVPSTAQSSYPYDNNPRVPSGGGGAPSDHYSWHAPRTKQQETVLDSPPLHHHPPPLHSHHHGQRPPVEGRDASLHRRNNRDVRDTGSSTASTDLPPTTPDYVNANVCEPGSGKPVIKPLPLRSVQRPDGQSPENKPEDHNANTPGSFSTATSNELSPYLRKEKLFPTSGNGTPTDFVLDNNDFEYDDYIPDMPDSIFNMDPQAYTLTWSKRPNTQSTGTTTNPPTDRIHESTA